MWFSLWFTHLTTQTSVYSLSVNQSEIEVSSRFIGYICNKLHHNKHFRVRLSASYQCSSTLNLHHKKTDHLWRISKLYPAHSNSKEKATDLISVKYTSYLFISPAVRFLLPVVYFSNCWISKNVHCSFSTVLFYMLHYCSVVLIIHFNIFIDPKCCDIQCAWCKCWILTFLPYLLIIKWRSCAQEF